MRLDRLLVGVLAEIEHLGRIGLQRQRDGFQLVGRVRQPRQHGDVGVIGAVELRAVAALERHAARRRREHRPVEPACRCFAASSACSLLK